MNQNGIRIITNSWLFAMVCLFGLSSCQTHPSHDTMLTTPVVVESNDTTVIAPDSTEFKEALVAYSKTLQGIPYKYASTDSAVGFDCSGFITHVFNHFNLVVPRSSVDFTNYGEEIPKEEAVPGDLILFTGTDSSIRVVGHMGIVVQNDPNGIQFIHSTSGKAYGVTITPLNNYYMGRFVKTIRVIN